MDTTTGGHLIYSRAHDAASTIPANTATPIPTSVSVPVPMVPPYVGDETRRRRLDSSGIGKNLGCSQLGGRASCEGSDQS